MSNISRIGDGSSKFYNFHKKSINYTTYIENKKREDKHGKESAEETSTLYISAETLIMIH
jgi:hypothetical protein